MYLSVKSLDQPQALTCLSVGDWIDEGTEGGQEVDTNGGGRPCCGKPRSVTGAQ